MKNARGLISRPSPYPVRETADRLEAILKSKGIRIFARIDQAAEAAAAGLTMPAMELLIFGNPKGGTPVMLADPEAGIDLPLKALIWQDSNGKAWLVMNDPAYLRERFGLSNDLIQPLAKATVLLLAAVDAG
jgi:uncharacterized protein (DUF302 family)